MSYNMIIIVHNAGTLPYLMVFFKFNFLALVVSEISGGPKFTLGGPAPPGHHLAEKLSYPKRVLYHTLSHLIVFLILPF